MVFRVRTGCHNCKRCTNSNAAEFGRMTGKAFAFLMTLGLSAFISLFTANCRACGHKLSLHDRTGTAGKGNSYVMPVQNVTQSVEVIVPPAPAPAPAPQPLAPAPRRAAVAPPPAGPPAGWYPDDAGALRWWDGVRWTEHVQPPPRPRASYR